MCIYVCVSERKIDRAARKVSLTDPRCLSGLERAMNFYGRPIRLYTRAEESDRKTPDRKRATGGWATKKTREREERVSREGKKRQRAEKIYSARIPHDRYGHRFSGRAPIALISPATRTRRFCAKRAGRCTLSSLTYRPHLTSPHLRRNESNETIEDRRGLQPFDA